MWRVGLDQDQAVGPDAEMAVADELGDLGRVLHCLLKTVYVDVVVADTVHFCEFHLSPPQSGCDLSGWSADYSPLFLRRWPRWTSALGWGWLCHAPVR